MDMLNFSYLSPTSFKLTPRELCILGTVVSERNIEELAKKLHDVFHRLIWFSYRKGFEPIQGLTGFFDHFLLSVQSTVQATLPALVNGVIASKLHNSDTGWGCMLRTGQMMLATALLKYHFTEEDWKNGNPAKYARIISLFNDSYSSTYSIHNIAIMGIEMGKAVGQWFGPSTISSVLKHLANNDSGLPIKIYTANQSVIYPTEIAITTSNWHHSLLLIVPTRLGVSGVNPVYFKTLQTYMRMPQSIGFIGGKPGAAYYFVGYQENSKDSDLQTYFYGYAPCFMPMTKLDESLALGFYCKDFEDFADFVNQVKYLEKNMPGYQALFSLEENSLQASGISLKTFGEDFDMYASLSAVWMTQETLEGLTDNVTTCNSWSELCNDDFLEKPGVKRSASFDLGSWTELCDVNCDATTIKNDSNGGCNSPSHASFSDLGMSFTELPERTISLNETGDDFSMDDSIFQHHPGENK